MDLFVYGTLQSPALMSAVAGGDLTAPAPARLDGFRLHRHRSDVVPAIVTDDAAHCVGVVWRGLTDAQRARLDLYERAFGYSLQQVRVDMAGQGLDVQCYIADHAVPLGGEGWSLAAWEHENLAPAILAAKELFAHDPWPSAKDLQRMWPMIETRAWAKHRARAAPALLRHDARPDDHAVLVARAPLGAFFRLQNMDVTHRRFDGDRSAVLVREAFIGVDAAIVLPYDPLRDRVVLVEQFRMGPVARHDPNPWMLEPVAGIVDARETPQQTAHREAFEEAGLHLRHLEPVTQMYPSPGSSSDYFYCYVGLCDIAQDAPYGGGLPSEGEDLRLHPVGLDHALALCDSGEIAAGPLVLLLNWLARHKDRLRAAG